MFDARAWLANREPEASGIADETLEVVGLFTLLWNLFEQRYCNKDASVAQIEKLVGGAAFGDALPPLLNDAMRYWTNRYVVDGHTNDLFRGLTFRKGDRRQFVEAVLCGNDSPPVDQLLALLIIVFRLRNNLFHGIKGLPTLNEQRENLNMACRALAATMDLLG